MRLARSWGHEVAVAVDGLAALSLAETFQPECAIVDLSMPGINGIELGRRLRQRFPPTELRLIALSGYRGPDIRDACLAAGFDAYLVKPGSIRELERRSEATARVPMRGSTDRRVHRVSILAEGDDQPRQELGPGGAGVGASEHLAD